MAPWSWAWAVDGGVSPDRQRTMKAIVNPRAASTVDDFTAGILTGMREGGSFSFWSGCVHGKTAKAHESRPARVVRRGWVGTVGRRKSTARRPANTPLAMGGLTLARRAR